MGLCVWCGCDKSKHTGGSGLCNTDGCECRHFVEGRYVDYDHFDRGAEYAVDTRVAVLLEHLDAIANECLCYENAEDTLNEIRTRIRNLMRQWQQ